MPPRQCAGRGRHRLRSRVSGVVMIYVGNLKQLPFNEIPLKAEAAWPG
jgi:hypothetical protein